MVKVTVYDGADFTVNGHDFRVYNGNLWIDGGENDDYLVREIPEMEALEYNDDEVEIEITAQDIEAAEFAEANS